MHHPTPRALMPVPSESYWVKQLPPSLNSTLGICFSDHSSESLPAPPDSWCLRSPCPTPARLFLRPSHLSSPAVVPARMTRFVGNYEFTDVCAFILCARISMARMQV